MPEHYEPFYNDDTLMVEFKLPEVLFPENLEPVKINKVELKDGWYLSEDKANII